MTEPATKLLSACRARGWRLAVAESCTGGLISAALTEIPGSSDVVDRGIVAYSHDAKRELLGVSDALSIEHGAVSEEVVLAMIDGLRHASDADVLLAVTGVAGPGGTAQKPEGMVWFGVQTPKHAPIATIQQFGQIGRKAVRKSAVSFAIEHVLAQIGQS